MRPRKPPTKWLRDGSLFIKRPCCGRTGVLAPDQHEVRIPHASTCPQGEWSR